MSQQPDLPLLDHQLADDELAWVQAVYRDFAAARAKRSEQGEAFNPKETLREILAQKDHALPTPLDLSGEGPWRNGRNSHDRMVACVFLQKIELHKHARSRTDQFPIYIKGEADAFSVGKDAQPTLQAVKAGDHFHNPPDAPHAFLPKIGQKADDWEIAFIAITPRNLKDDTQKVSEETRSAYRQIVGAEAPVGL